MATNVRNVGSPLSPGIAVFQNMLYMAVRRSENNEVNLLRFNGRTWAEFGSVPGVRTPSAPSLASFQDRLYLAVRGQDNFIYLTAYDGTQWSAPWRAPGVGKTLSGPAIIQFGNLMHLTYTAEQGYRVQWVAFNPRLRYGTYTVRPGEHDLRDVSRAVFGGNPNRYKEIALLNYLKPQPGTDVYSVTPGDVLLTPV